MTNRIEAFAAERARLNEVVMRHAGTNMKRFWALDHQAYLDGALLARTKELLGLVASLVLRCDDCVLYHVAQCHDLRPLSGVLLPTAIPSRSSCLKAAMRQLSPNTTLSLYSGGQQLP